MSPTPAKSPIDAWGRFLSHEKLTPSRVPDPMVLVSLCERLAQDGPPCIRMHLDTLASRTRVVKAAMDMGIDLAGIRYRGRPAMGRGLLDAWNREYAARFGSTVGTAGEREVKRRGVKTRLAGR